MCCSVHIIKTSFSSRSHEISLHSAVKRGGTKAVQDRVSGRKPAPARVWHAPSAITARPDPELHSDNITPSQHLRGCDLTALPRPLHADLRVLTNPLSLEKTFIKWACEPASKVPIRSCTYAEPNFVRF
ncbi:hypothetical protein Bbelb_329160 [Branchiostoma belcheri]|nr:hypothetical protein Bbelb_329160 [Branchiostoma belcheri]